MEQKRHRPIDVYARNPVAEFAARFIDIQPGVELLWVNLQKRNVFVKELTVKSPPRPRIPSMVDTMCLYPRYKSANARAHLWSMGVMAREGRKGQLEWAVDSITVVNTPENRIMLIKWLHKRGDGESFRALEIITSMYPYDFVQARRP